MPAVGEAVDTGLGESVFIAANSGEAVAGDGLEPCFSSDSLVDLLMPVNLELRTATSKKTKDKITKTIPGTANLSHIKLLWNIYWEVSIVKLSNNQIKSTKCYLDTWSFCVSSCY